MPADWKSALSKVPPERRAALEAALAEADGFTRELEAGYLRQEDYSTKMNAAEVARREWEAEKALMEETYSKAKENYDSLLADWNSTTAERNLAKEQLGDSQRALEEAKAKATIDPAKVLTIDQYKSEMAQIQAGRIAYETEALDYIFELESLTKSRIKPGEFIRESLASGKPIAEYVESKYQFSAKKEAAAAEEKRQAEDRIRSDEREKVVAQYANPATRPLAESKDPFYTPAVDKVTKQPWELTETPADELAILNELGKARVQ